MCAMRVECYSGYRADESPFRFTVRGRQFEVNDLDGRWRLAGRELFSRARR